MKSIPPRSMHEHELSIRDQYLALFRGESVLYDLSTVCKFEWVNSFVIRNRQQLFTRRIQFKTKANTVVITDLTDGVVVDESCVSVDEFVN